MAMNASVSAIQDMEERVKQGRLQDKLGVELIIIKYSA